MSSQHEVSVPCGPTCTGTRFANLDTSLIEYEIARLQNMIHVEQKNWRHAHNYDMVIDGLGMKSSMAGITDEQLLGYIRLHLGPVTKH